MSTILDLQKKAFQNKVDHGFNTSDVQTEFLLTYGELAEAYEAWLKKKTDVGEELADVMIYILGLAEILHINLEEELEAKMQKNAARKYTKKDGILTKEEK